MLKALELSGFKSFADKTRFEFPPGITVIVGPNGSGKSNIVDAIKWVLGEQSAKSLRGKDMSDVIFKGSSGANARKPSGSATATLVFENADGRLMHDAPEVHVTRRVYRSGESEFLINSQPCRLKDIRNLFRGTGVGTDAYSLIEQGKVDRLLQASARDRRAIFEEAAGISRFKAKKIEAERRLERVESNLTRLADIVEEVGNRYRSIKSQAAKAARYRELTKRLQHLRTYVGVKDYRAFSDKILENDSDLQRHKNAADHAQSEIAALQVSSAELESQLDTATSDVSNLQDEVAKVREAIAQAESIVELNRQRRIDLMQRKDQSSVQFDQLSQKIAELTTALQTNLSQLAAAGVSANQATQRVAELSSQLDDTDARLSELATQIEIERARLGESQANIVQLNLKIASQSTQAESARALIGKWRSETTAAEAELAEVSRRHQETDARRKAVEQHAEQTDSALRDANQNVESGEAELAQAQQQLAELRTRFAGVTQRAKVIEELEKRLEGVHAGTKDLLQRARQTTSGPLTEIVGLVADLIQVNVQHAALVDAALGQIAQYVVVNGNTLFHEIAQGKLNVTGRVTLVSLQQSPELRVDPRLDLIDDPLVIGPVHELVQIAAAHREFVQSMFAGTWIVKSLVDALTLHARYPRQARFVTLDGEIVESDGMLVVGPKSAVIGIVSRRSELRALNTEQQALKAQIAECEDLVDSTKRKLRDAQALVKKLISQNQSIFGQLNELSAQCEASQYTIRTLTGQIDKSREEWRTAQQTVDEIQSHLTADKESVSANTEIVDRLQRQAAQDNEQLTSLQQMRVELEQQATTAKVHLAKLEQQLADLNMRVTHSQAGLDDYQRSQTSLTIQLADDAKAINEAESAMNVANESLAKLAIQRESLAEKNNALINERSAIDARRRETSERLQHNRMELRRVEEKLNDCTVRARQLDLERTQLAERLREDYGFDVEQVLGGESAEETASREEIDREITELRQKLGSIGAVNMQALADLEELEQRYQTLDSQYQDLAAAKESLLKIIHKINNDSRRLFVETLEAIRANFQKLFRQTFGGGQADIMLEDGVDVLEAGVEIIATPPGKPKFNNSLLSGGEKALTAVSLLMAIFQFRPSPFCVLDEVDAPFDEANIGRFIDVLKSFLGWTKFVIVTHSKKTMTAATTLYGITMQESGVSKRVSVRFEDVSEDGKISDEAVRRSAGDEIHPLDDKTAVA